MIRRLTALLFIFWFCLGCIAQGASWLPLGVPQASGLAIDGFINGHASSSPVIVSLTTTKTNDVITVFVAQNACTYTGISVSDTASLTWARRATNFGSTSANEFSAVSSGILSSDSITVACSGASYLEATAFGVSGGHIAAPYDTNGALPYQANSGNASITTSNANDMLLAFFRASTNACSTSGFAAIGTGNFSCAQYLVVSTTQSALSVTAPSGTNGVIGDALIKGP